MENTRSARIRLRHLQAFLAVTRLGNLRRAAEALAVTQPAVTKTINDLEEILGVKLFQRGRRGAVPTPEAERFLHHASASAQELELAVASVRPDRGAALLRVGVLPTVTTSFVPRAVVSFKSAHPGVRLRIVSAANAELLSLLQQREVDLVVGRLSEPAPMSGLTFEHLYSDALVVAVRSGHPSLARARTEGLAGWTGFDAVLPMPGTIIRHAADSLMTKLGMQPAAGYTETLSASLGRALTLSSDALWFVPFGAVQVDVDAGLLGLAPTSTQGTEEPVGLLMANDAIPTGPALAFMATLREEAKARREAPAAPGVLGSSTSRRRSAVKRVVRR